MRLVGTTINVSKHYGQYRVTDLSLPLEVRNARAFYTLDETAASLERMLANRTGTR
jgi:hypothetical protein